MNGIFDNLTSLEGQNFIDTVQVLGHIGAGNSAVFLVVDIKSGENFAMKEVILQDEQQYNQVKQEIRLLEMLGDQDFVVRMHKYMICEQISKNEFQDETHKIAYILMERGQTSLSKFIELQETEGGGYMTIAQILKFVHTTIRGFAYLQEQCIAHRDIKPENILLMDAQQLHIKVCDVGSGQELTENHHNSTHTIQGTIPFLAPEIIECFAQRQVKVNAYKADVFSLGLCFLYLITFHKMNSRDRRELPPQVYKEVIKEWTRQAIQIVGKHSLIIRLLYSMLMFDVESRLDFVQLNQELKKNFIEEDTSCFYKTLNLIHEVKLQVTTDIIQAPIKQILRRQQSANKPKMLSQMTSPVESLKPAISKNLKLKSQSLRTEVVLKLPLLNKDTQSFQDTVPSKLGLYESTKLLIQPKIIHLTTQIDSTLAVMLRVSSDEDLGRNIAHTVTFGIWFDGHYSLQVDLLVSFLHSQPQLQTLSLKFGVDVKLIDLTCKTQIHFSLRSLVIDVQCENIWHLILLLITKSSDTLQYFEIRINLPEVNYQCLESIGQCLTLCERLCSIKIRVCASAINYEKVHKVFLQSLIKCHKIQELSILVPKNNLIFAQPQWTFSEKLRTLRINYSHNQIGRSLNSLSLALSNLIKLEQLDMNIAGTETNLKDVNFLIDQISKLVCMQDLTLNVDHMLCFNDQTVMLLLSSITKLPLVHSVSLSLVGMQLNPRTIYECLHFFEKINVRSSKSSRNEFSLRMNRMVSKNEVIRYSINKKLLVSFKIDFLTNNTQSLQVVYLKTPVVGVSHSIKYAQVCNNGLDLITSQMNICITCSDKYSPILKRCVVVCEQCALNCHTFPNIIKSQSATLKRGQPSQQRHNIIKYNMGGPCDCLALGKCKLSYPTHCSSNDELDKLQMSVKCANENEIVCLWCRKFCHANQRTQLLYPTQFKCACSCAHPT